MGCLRFSATLTPASYLRWEILLKRWDGQPPGIWERLSRAHGASDPFPKLPKGAVSTGSSYAGGGAQ